MVLLDNKACKIFNFIIFNSFLGGLKFMDSNKVDIFFVSKAKYFPQDKIVIMREKMLSADDSKFNIISSIDLKDPIMLLVLSILFGSLGVDRFLIGDIGMGVLKLLTGGLCGILTIVDWFLIQSKAKEMNYNAVMMAL